MLKNITVMFTAILILSAAGSAQNATVKGTVKDAGTGEALIGVNIVTNQSGATTGLDGDYTLELPVGTYTLSYQYLGYNEVVRTVNLGAGQLLVLDVQMEEASILGETVVVSAGKYEQSLNQVTVSMEVLKPNIIENRNTTSFDEVIQQTPGVSIVDSEPQIRSGSGYSFGAGSRVMILVDDLPILSGDAGRPSWGFMPVENVSQVEVIKGASSVLYGSSALSGVINLRTAYPTDVPKTKIILSGGVYSEPSVDGAKYWDETPALFSASFLHSRIINNLDFTIGGNFLSDDGHIGQPVDTTDDRGSQNRRGRMNVNLRYRPATVQGLDFGLNANFQRGRSLGTLIWADADSGLYRPFAGSATVTEQTVLTVDPFINFVNESGTRHSLKGRYYKLDNDNTNNQGNFSDVFYGEYQIQQHFEPLTGIKDLTVTAGLVGTRTDGEADLYIANEDSSGENTAKNYAAYLQLDKTFVDRFTFSAGARYENFDINGVGDSKTIFRTGLNVHVAKELYLRGSFGQGYRFPSIAEKFIRTNAGGLEIFPNRDLQPESSWNAEAGIKMGFKAGQLGGYLDVAYFHQQYEDFIEFTFNEWGTTPIPFLNLGFRSMNTGKARVRGVDLSLTSAGKIGGVEVNFLGGYTYTDPEALDPDLNYTQIGFDEVSYLNTSSDTTDNILKYRMQHLVRADLEFGWKNVLLGGSLRFNSFMNNIDRIFLDLDELGVLRTGLNQWREENPDGDYVFDLRLGYTIAKGSRLSLVVNNLLNNAYSIRPLRIESNRLVNLQFTQTL